VKPEGWLAPLPYSFIRDCYERHNGRLLYHYNINNGPEVYTNDWTGCIGVGTATGIETLGYLNAIYVPSGVPDSWKDQAIVKARLAMKDQDVNLGLAFAERNQTARLVGDTARQLAGAMKRLKRGDFRGAGRKLGIDPGRPKTKTVASRWLELQYGWKPLLSDVHGAAEALAKRQAGDWVVTGKGSKREAINVEKILGTVSSVGYGLGVARGTKGVYVRIDAIPQNDLLLSMKSVGVTNPAVIAWDKLRYSFVVDWFLPVGDFLDSLDAMLGYGPTWCSISVFERSVVSHRLLSSTWSTGTSPKYNHTHLREGSGRRERVSLTRTVSTTVPLPLLPRFKDPVSLSHMANGLALLRQAFR
jgi:hypothetical protein